MLVPTGHAERPGRRRDSQQPDWQAAAAGQHGAAAARVHAAGMPHLTAAAPAAFVTTAAAAGLAG
jgi:hypothetical protein